MKIALALVLVFVASWMPSSAPLRGDARAAPEPAVSYQLDANLPVAVAARLVCHLVADNPSAANATVLGVDGAPSLVSGGVANWFFGDTFRSGPGGRRDVIPSGFATSTDLDARDCVRLDFKTNTDGIVDSLFPRGDETTAWPDGVLALPGGGALFYMVKTYRQSPTEWNIGAIGLGSLDPGSVDGVRLVERIWDDHSGFPGALAGVRSPLRVGDDVMVYVNTSAGNFLARAPFDRVGEAAAYSYWDGATWSSDPRSARSMWTPAPHVLPSDNGLSVAFDDRVGKWEAVYNSDLWHVKVRTADQPWGPWSDPITWFDCQALVGPVYPYCYSSALHSELSRDNGSTLYVTFANPEPYDVSLVELHLGVAIHAWIANDNSVRYAAFSPEGSYRDAGVVFYAADTPQLGLQPIYEAPVDGSYRYVLTQPSADAQPVFFAYAAELAGAIHTKPVYRWQRGGREILDPDERTGWERGEVAFYVACTDLRVEGSLSVCAR